MGATPASVEDVIARLHDINDQLEAGDGVRVFNDLYLTVTERLASGIDHGRFGNPPFMSSLDVNFASLWLAAYDAPAGAAPKPWAPLFESRHNQSVLAIQFALAGMNAHIEHDLPLAVVQTCREHGVSPETAGVHGDFEAVNDLLADCEAEIRRSFLTDAARAATAEIEPVVHLVNSWKIDSARDVAWVSAEVLWTMRAAEALADRYLATLARTVAMASRCLLTPTRLVR